MNSPRAQEMDKLQRIQSQLQAIAHKIDERLPHQRATMAALVCAWRWRLRTLHAHHSDAYTTDLVEATAKRVRMEVGTFEYAAKEQGELLTRYLCELDNILSHGNPEIKEARKALVVEIQTLLERADALKMSATQLKEFALRAMDSLPQGTEQVGVPGDDAMDEGEATTPIDNDAVDEKMETEPAQSGEESEEEQTDLRAVFDESTDGDEDIDESEDESRAMEDDSEPQSAPEQPQPTEADEEHDSLARLPVWRPYYQMQKHHDGVYVVVNLHGADPRYLRVESVPREGVLRVAGVKFPTQKDLLLSQLSGSPTFGRFEIVERFPVGVLALEHASQQLLRDGTLQVRLPYAIRQAPRIVRRVSPYMIPGLMAW